MKNSTRVKVSSCKSDPLSKNYVIQQCFRAKVSPSDVYFRAYVTRGPINIYNNIFWKTLNIFLDISN